ncbi:unnamed protein product [Rhodiola kirilowii]
MYKSYNLDLAKALAYSEPVRPVGLWLIRYGPLSTHGCTTLKMKSPVTIDKLAAHTITALDTCPVTIDRNELPSGHILTSPSSLSPHPHKITNQFISQSLHKQQTVALIFNILSNRTMMKDRRIAKLPAKITPCCSKDETIKRGPWTAEEDEVLARFIAKEGEGRWRTLPSRAGLMRCGKSCRLRWMNYLRPSVKRGRIAPDEEDLILRLHRLLGNRWSLIAGRIPGRTDNEIKNYWNTHLSKKLISQGIDPRTHRPLENFVVPAASCDYNVRPAVHLQKDSYCTGTSSCTAANSNLKNHMPNNIIPKILFSSSLEVGDHHNLDLRNVDRTGASLPLVLHTNNIIDHNIAWKNAGGDGGLMMMLEMEGNDHFDNNIGEDIFSSYLNSLINEDDDVPCLLVNNKHQPN